MQLLFILIEYIYFQDVILLDEDMQLIKKKSVEHENLKHSCDQCNYSAKRYDHLRLHKESKHQGINYPCNQCNYSASRFDNLKIHKESKHDGIKYPCRCV